MSISSSTRFKVFERDGFTCRYCGRSVPDVVLELDHIHPKSQGGADTEANFAAACQDCNRGKGARILGALPISKTLVGKWFHILNSEGYAAYQGQGEDGAGTGGREGEDSAGVRGETVDY